MKTLSIDIECYSSANLTDCGVYKYTESPDFEILLFSYSEDGGEVKTVDLASGEKIPSDIISALSDDSVKKWAHNANFERICLSRFLGHPKGTYLNPKSWFCSMVWASVLNLPPSLEKLGSPLKIENSKLETGKKLINLFSMPQKSGRVLPCHFPTEWASFKEYNIRDVEAQDEIRRRLESYPVRDALWEEYWLDQRINDRGVLLDIALVNSAIGLGKTAFEELLKLLSKQTGLENPNSPQQMKSWLAKEGVPVKKFDKDTKKEMLESASVPEHVKEVLRLSLQLSKTSVKKYQAMKGGVCDDGRLRGMFRFYGASRTGRWSGTLAQLQNLPKNTTERLDEARECVLNNDYEALSEIGDVPDLLSQLIRTAIISPVEGRLVVADFNAIEARVLAWLAGEDWRIKAFEAGKDIYCASASAMFGVPVEKDGVNAELRQKGKIAELALGYGGSVGALTRMGALRMGLSESELPELVDSWRKANPNIKEFWVEVEKAACAVIRDRVSRSVNGIKFSLNKGFLVIRLPSGRALTYLNPKIEEDEAGYKNIVFEGFDSKTQNITKFSTYGAKLTENIVQGISRDILCLAMQNLASFSIVAHVHDELIIEADRDLSVEDVCKRMSVTPVWAEGLPLNAHGYYGEFYFKD